MKPPKPIPRYKTGTCKECGKENTMLTAGRCINSPYCYKKHWAGISNEKKHNSLTGAEIESKKVYTIPNQSDKRKKLDAVYNIAAARFKKDKPVCEIQLPGCTYHTTAVHHLYSGSTRSKYYLDMAEWKATCWHCHHIVHDVLSMDEAIKLGLKKIE